MRQTTMFSGFEAEVAVDTREIKRYLGFIKRAAANLFVFVKAIGLAIGQIYPLAFVADSLKRQKKRANLAMMATFYVFY